MKKFKILFIFVLLFIGVSYVKAFDTTQKVYDYANLLTIEEEQKLKELANDYISKYNMDIVMVTVKNKVSTKVYAEDFYDYNGFGIGNTHDGILFVINVLSDGKDVYILTTGEAIIIYDDYRIDKILDSIEYVKDSSYYNWFETFVNESSYYAREGRPSSNNNVYIDSDGDPYEIQWPGIIIISLIIPTIVLIILIKKNKMIRKSMHANEYIVKDSIKVTNRSDNFLTTHTTSVRINNTSSSSGGRSRVGGSSISRGSSGRSHGGGGRRF